MVVPLNVGKADSQGASRRSTRMAIAIPITISGKDAEGRTFKENCRTVIINKHGARISTFHELALGTELLLENRALGRAAPTTVVWLGDRRSPKDPSEVGLQLNVPENIWGIDFPPEDWQEGPPIGEGGRRLGEEPAAASATAPAPAPAAAVPAAPMAPEASPPPASGPVTTAATAASAAELGGVARVSLERLMKQFEGALQDRARQLEQRLAQQEAKAVQALEQKCASLDQRLQSARADLDGLVNKVEELRKVAEAEVEKTQRNIQTASFVAVQGATEELSERVREKLESSSAQFVEETRHRVHGAAAAALETFSKEASGRLSQLAEDIFARIAPELDARQSQTVNKASEEIARRAQAALEALQRGSDALVGGFQGQLEKATRTAQEQVAREVSEKIQRTAGEFLNAASQNVQRQATNAVAALTGELKASTKGVIDEAKSQLEAQRQQVLEVLTADARTLAKEYPIQVRKQLQDFQDQRTRELEDHLQKALEKQRQAVLKQIQKVGEDVATQAVALVKSQCEQVAQDVVGDVRKREGVAADALKDWEEQVRTRLEEYSKILEGSAKAAAEALQEQIADLSKPFLEKSQRAIEERIKEFTLKQIEESDKEFDKRTAENLELVTEQLREKQEEIVNEAIELFRNQIGQMFMAPQRGSRKSTEPSGAAESKKQR